MLKKTLLTPTVPTHDKLKVEQKKYQAKLKEVFGKIENKAKKILTLKNLKLRNFTWALGF